MIILRIEQIKMKEIKFLLIGCVFLMIGCKQEQSKVVSQEVDILNEKFDEYFSALTQMEKFNGVIFVSKDGNEIIHKAYNLSADEENSLQVNKSSQFDIHSISKKMAQYLILKLETGNKMNRKDKLSQYISDFPRGNDITIEMLMQHKSGLPRDFSNFEGKKIELGIEEMVDLIKQEALIFEPGENAQYSNLGYQLLYYVIGKLTDSTFEQHLVDALFTPLKMDNSGSHFYSNQKNIQNLAANHELDGDTIIRVANILDDESKMGRIYSNAADLMLLLDDFQNNPLSIQIAKDSIIAHSGGSDGIRTHIFADLNTKTNFVLLTNFDGIPFGETLKDMSNIIKNKPYKVPQALNRKSVAAAPSILKLYEGTYVFPDMNIELLIEAKEGKLIVFQDGEEAGKLVPENDSTFFEDPKAAESFEFKRNANGNYDVLMGWKGAKVKGIRK